MYKRILILVLLVISVSYVFPQGKPDPKEIDAKTYSLYMAGKWEELSNECENAIDSGIDFFYLRLRGGIAYYKNSDYLSAIKHFEKALAFNPTDAVTMEYLYYSYLFTGRESDVLSLIWVMPLELKKKLQVYSKFIYGAYTEGGYTINGDIKEQKRKNMMTPQTVLKEQKINDNSTYLNLSLKHQLGRRVKVFHGYNNISLSSVKQIREITLGQKDFDLVTKQDEYYLNININAGAGFDISTAFHFLSIRNENVYVEYKNTVNPPQPVYVKMSERMNDFAVMFSLTKFIGHFNVGLKNSLSNLNRATQVQNTSQVIFYPLGNLNFYTITNVTLLSNCEWGSKFKSNGILEQKAGWKMFDNLWMEAGYTFGNIYNYNENDAFILFNNVEKISNRISFNMIAPVSNHIKLSLRYQVYNQEVYSLAGYSNQTTNWVIEKNINHKIIGGLEWTF